MLLLVVKTVWNQSAESVQVGLGDREDIGPMPKVFRPMINRDALVDPNSSDHVVAITELREQVATLQKQLLSKDHQLLLKEKQVSVFLSIASLL